MALTEVNSLGIKDGEVKTADIAADAVTGAKIADDAVGAEHIEDLDADVKWVDSAKAKFGAGNDLEIYHDGSHSRVVDSGTGKLMLQGSSVLLTNAAGNETLAEFTENGAASLRYDNSTKFETTSAGATVTGTLTATLADNSVGLAQMAGGTDGQIITYDASGDPVAVGPGTDGQVLTSTGAGSPPAFEDAAAGGLTEVDLWRLTSTFSGSSSPISSNLARANGGRGFAEKGTGMSQSSGVFSFPSTGHWRVTFNAGWYYSSPSSNCAAEIQYTSDDGSNWNYAARAQTHIEDWSSYNVYAQAHAEHYIDVTDTSNQKVRFIVAVHESPNCEGNTNENRTYMSFQKLADT